MYMDGRTDERMDGRTDEQGDSYIPPTLWLRGYKDQYYALFRHATTAYSTQFTSIGRGIKTKD